MAAVLRHPPAPFIAPVSGTLEQRLAQIADAINTKAAIGDVGTGSAGVSSFNTRAGAVTFLAADITGVGGALLASPVFTGVPAAPTASPGTNTTQLATTAFVSAATAAATAGVASFNTRTGAVVLTSGDVTAVLPASTITPIMDGTAAIGTSTNSWARADHVHPTDTSRASAASVPIPSGTAPGMDSVANAGTLSTYSRGDHVHPTDSSRYAASNPAGYVTSAQAAAAAPVQSVASKTGAVTLVHTDITDWTATLAPYATSASVPLASSTNPIMDGAVAIGTGTTWARADHVHPSDTSRYAVSNPSGYQTAANVTTALAAGQPGAFSTLSASGTATLSGGGTLTGTFAGSPTFSGTVTLNNAVILSSAGNNTAIGSSTLAAIGAGTNETAIGANALQSVTSGVSNTAVGSAALAANLTGSNNVAIGVLAGTALLTNFNTAVGSAALAAAAGANNTAVGYHALYATTGANNTAVGQVALQADTTGASNVAVGAGALAALTTTNFNVAIGTSALVASVADSQNTAVGHAAMVLLNGGNSNTGLGMQVGNKLTTGGSNLLLGNQVATVTLATGSRNILLGTANNTDAPTAGTNDYFAIGASTGATPLMSGSLVAASLSLRINGTIGFNNTAPVAKPTGWGTSTGGARGPITGSSTLAQVATALSQLLTDLQAYGLLGT